MWIFSNIFSIFADSMIESGRFTHTITRKIINSIGLYGPAICLIIASYTGCNRYLTVAILTIGLGLNGGIYSGMTNLSKISKSLYQSCLFHFQGFKINHLDITPRFAGILMAITNCSANFAGLLAPMAAGNIIEGKPTIAQWRIVFLIAAVVYIVCATFYNIFATGERQKWDNPELDNQNFHTPKAVDNENGLKKRHDVEETKY